MHLMIAEDDVNGGYMAVVATKLPPKGEQPDILIATRVTEPDDAYAWFLRMQKERPWERKPGDRVN